MSKFALLHKFPHWSEVLAVLSYADNSNVEFVHHKRGEVYKDPLGREYECFIKSHFDPSETTLICNGSIHLETHVLSRGKIPYAALPYKLAIEHTTGYSPWDFLQMIRLAEISATEPENAQGSKVLYAINDKCCKRFLATDWIAAGKPYYEEWKPRIEEMIRRGYVVPTEIEPAQFWLENVPHTEGLEHSDHICLCLNWCNLNKVTKVKHIVELCKLLHTKSGKEIDIRLHSYSRESLFHILDALPYVHLIPYESMSKYDVMDKYDMYFVDGTGLGYEIAYRNCYNNRPIDIFYLVGLSSDEELGGFDGIRNMGATPIFTHEDYLDGITEHSNFSNEVIRESFPHTPGNVANECYEIMQRLSEVVRTLK